MAGALVPLPDERRFTLRHAPVPRDDFAHDVRDGLTAAAKRLPPRWFYDDLGSALFDAICFLPEYYVMRAEKEVLTAHATDIARAFGTNVRLVELGSGAARKTRILLDAVTARQPELEYAPVDIDENMLQRTGRELLGEYPGLSVTAICGDFRRPGAALSLLPRSDARTIVLFLGSTIGNLDPGEAVTMLGDLRAALSRGDALFLGADLRKSPAILEAAYNDAMGVTAAFNLNLLVRINRELGGTFALDAFRHTARYDEERGCIDMELVSQCAQRVRIEALDLDIDFAAGERIHTENSWKHDPDTLSFLARESGYTIERTWTDTRGWFADVLFVAT